MMEDDELAQIRAQRMAQMKQQQGPSPEQMQAMEEQQRNMMHTLLSSGARERLSRIQMVKPEKARQVESIIMRMAQSGQLQSQIEDKQLVDLLNQISDDSVTKVVIQRRRDEDDY